MNPQELRQAAAVMLAHADAQEQQGCRYPTGFQCRKRAGGDWIDGPFSPHWNWADTDYRQKPAPALKPWSAGEGVLLALRMKRGAIAAASHFENGRYYFPIGGWFSPDELLRDFTQLDGSPCGTLEP